MFCRVYSYGLLGLGYGDLEDLQLELAENHGMLYEFAQDDCLCCGLQGAAFVGENCGICCSCYV